MKRSRPSRTRSIYRAIASTITNNVSTSLLRVLPWHPRKPPTIRRQKRCQSSITPPCLHRNTLSPYQTLTVDIPFLYTFSHLASGVRIPRAQVWWNLKRQLVANTSSTKLQLRIESQPCDNSMVRHAHDIDMQNPQELEVARLVSR
jgi:hypothetical protein